MRSVRNARRIAVLENVVNPTNVGAIFRSAAALGYGCGAVDSRMQQSPVPPCDPRQHGNSISGPVDDFSG